MRTCFQLVRRCRPAAAGIAAGASMIAAALVTMLTASLATAQTSPLTQKINAAVECINRLSERAYESRKRYASWSAKSGPTGKERIIYGTYTIYDTADCRKKVEAANALEPREGDLEAAAAAYVVAVMTLEPLLKDADDYYSQQNYKDDRMAKGKALHPRLVAAWDAFETADKALRAAVEMLQEKSTAERIAEIERTEGKRGRYHVETIMLQAKQLLRLQQADKPDLARIIPALEAFETRVRSADALAQAGGEQALASGFADVAKTFMTSSKQLMRRVRDKTPYSSGDRMMINAGSGWMVEGSPARLTRDYNQLVESYNRVPAR